MTGDRLQAWPQAKLETVNKCPVCGGSDFELLQADLIDQMSSPQTGPWAMQQCRQCQVANLSPRPTSDSISQAYQTYYTHSSDKDNLVPGRLRRIKDSLAGRYYASASGKGTLLDHLTFRLTRLIIPISTYLDTKSRHIFQRTGEAGRLLDVGCGNGDFIQFASQYGWDVVGIDFDEAAIAKAATHGLDARIASIDDLDADDLFDFISLNHVIEHVHDPVDVFRQCYAHLRDGGTLWFETPNVGGFGRSYYQRDWRGFEPPRHLFLFNCTALEKLTTECGFTSVEQRFHGLSGLYMGLASEKIRASESNALSAPIKWFRRTGQWCRALMIEVLQLARKNRREFLTFIARR